MDAYLFLLILIVLAAFIPMAFFGAQAAGSNAATRPCVPYPPHTYKNFKGD